MTLGDVVAFMEERYWSWDPVGINAVSGSAFKLNAMPYVLYLSNIRTDDYIRKDMGSALHYARVHNGNLIPQGRLIGPDAEENITSIWTGCATVYRDEIKVLYTATRFEGSRRHQHISEATFDKEFNIKNVTPRILSSDQHDAYADSSLTFGVDSTGRTRIGALRDPFEYPVNPGSYLIAKKGTVQRGVVFAQRTKEKGPFNACIGFARYNGAWHMEEPLFAPGTFSEMELPHMVRMHNDELLFFSAYPRHAMEPASSPFYGYRLRGRLFEPLNGNGNIPVPPGLYGIRVWDVDDDVLKGIGFYDGPHSRRGGITSTFNFEYDPKGPSIVYQGKDPLE